METTIGGIPFANELWNGTWILGWFFFFSLLIILMAKINVNFIQIIAMKKNLSPIFIGGIVLSIITSLPELITSFFAGVEDKLNPNNPTGGAFFSYFNVTGANALQAFILGFFGVFIFIVACRKSWKTNKPIVKKEKINSFALTCLKDGYLRYYTPYFKQFYGNIVYEIVHKKMFVICFAVFQYICTIIVLKVPIIANAISVNGFNFLNLLWILVWIGFLIWSSLQKNTDTEYDQKLLNSKLWKLPFGVILFIFFIAVAIFALIAYLNAGIVRKFETVLGVRGSIGAGFILSFATSLPEISSFTLLIIAKKYNTAVSGLIGSTIFNNCLPFFTNVVSLRSFYSDYDQLINNNQYNLANSDVKETFNMANQIVPWCALLIIITSLLGIGAYKKVANKPFLSMFLLGMVAIGYIIGFVVISLE